MSIILRASMRVQVTVVAAVAVSFLTSSNVRCSERPVVALSSKYADLLICWLCCRHTRLLNDNDR